VSAAVGMTATPADHRAVVTVVRGSPTPDELAAALACLATIAARHPAPHPAPHPARGSTGWSRAARRQLLRSPVPPSRGWSGRPGGRAPQTGPRVFQEARHTQ
jgi:Acyl-CoA carboxylase epsilon subunit